MILSPWQWSAEHSNRRAGTVPRGGAEWLPTPTGRAAGWSGGMQALLC